jgi:hypothetical protein
MAMPAGAQTIRLRILDENGNPTAARVRLRDRQGTLHPVPAVKPGDLLPAHPRFPDLGVIVKGDCAIEVPDPDLTIEVDRGTEYLPQTFAAVQGPPKDVRLQRWVDAAARGWWPADLHVHRNPADMPLLMEAAALSFAPAITKWNENSNLETWPEQPMVRVAASRFYSVDNAEDERPWGAALFFGLKRPIRLYGGKANWPPPTATWEEARSRQGFIDLEKVIWWAAPVMAALSRPDTIGVANNHFLEEGLLDMEAWGPPRDRAKYPGQAGFANYIFDLYYTYLSAGMRIPASAGSANGVLKSPLGYSRSYVFLGNNFTPESWFAGQKAGRNFVTNGPMLFLKANGEWPGTVLPAAAKKVTIELEAMSRGQLERAELIVNGAVARTVRPGTDRSRIRASETLAVSAGDWIAARCFEANHNTIRFAHTSPVYVGDTARRDAAAIARLRERIDRYMEQVEALPAETLHAEQKEEWLALCRKARDAYR